MTTKLTTCIVATVAGVLFTLVLAYYNVLNARGASLQGGKQP
jgi:ABC-type sulfate transport system permease component